MCILRKRNYKYQCTQCSNIVCVVCAEKVKEDCVGYDEESYRVGKCPQDKCAHFVNSSTDGKSGKRKKNTANIIYSLTLVTKLLNDHDRLKGFLTNLIPVRSLPRNLENATR